MLGYWMIKAVILSSERHNDWPAKNNWKLSPFFQLTSCSTSANLTCYDPSRINLLNVMLKGHTFHISSQCAKMLSVVPRWATPTSWLPCCQYVVPKQPLAFLVLGDVVSNYQPGSNVALSNNEGQSVVFLASLILQDKLGQHVGCGETGSCCE
jgi:hypothetical protein